MQFTIIPVTPYQQNCSLIWCEQTNKAAVVDPGGDLERIIEAIDHAGVELTMILLTHGHLDHVGAAAKLAAHYQLPITGPHIDDEFLLASLPTQSQMFGFPHTDAFQSNHYLTDGEQIQLGQVTLDVVHTPGHTPGHVVLVDQKSRLAFVGDVLFRGSIGRTDFPRSNHQHLLSSITQKLWPLGHDIEFVPGHGPMSSFGQERASNPFVADQLFG